MAVRNGLIQKFLECFLGRPHVDNSRSAIPELQERLIKRLPQQSLGRLLSLVAVFRSQRGP